MKGTAFVLVLPVFVIVSCTYSTRFVPPPDGKMYLMIKNNDIYAYKNNAFIGGLSQVISPDDFCDDRAIKNVREANVKYKEAQNLDRVSTIFTVISLPLLFISPLWSLIVETIGSVISASAQDKEREAYTLFINAINQHNDNPECIKKTEE